MHINDFTYTLPDENIAIFPPKQRGQAKLLVLDRISGNIKHRSYPDLVDYLNSGDVVVLNNTKVIKARLNAINESGQQRELLLLESHGNSYGTKSKFLYKGKLHKNEQLSLNGNNLLVSNILQNGLVEISSDKNIMDLVDMFGVIPLPPYMNRDANTEDTRRYQTAFAKQAGSVAAPTASLNFTNELKDALEVKGVKVVCLTLHVGIGTFMPIRTDNIEDHVMHSEYFEIPKATVATIQKAKESNKSIVAIGTTVARSLEYTADKITNNPTEDLIGEANIFIYPGYQFKIVDKLLTNFHAPKSTVLMLAAAFSGWQNLKNAYDEALEQNYKFLSYGDSMLTI